MNKENKIIDMGTIKGQEWIGKKVTLLRKIPNRTHEVEITLANGWDAIELKDVNTGRKFIINQYGEQGDLSFQDIEIMEVN